MTKTERVLKAALRFAAACERPPHPLDLVRQALEPERIVEARRELRKLVSKRPIQTREKGGA